MTDPDQGDTRKDEAMLGVNRVIDAVLAERVRLHIDRAKRRLTETAYGEGLRACRDAEIVLEKARSALGAPGGRARELFREPTQ